MSRTYCLNDKTCMDEYQNKTIRWLIINDKGLVHLLVKTNEIKLTKIARAYLDKRLRDSRKNEVVEYRVDPKIMKAYYSIPRYAY